MNVQELLIYQSDDTTLLTSCTTDPVGTRPYLHFVLDGPEFEADMLRGTASISQVSVRVVDVPTDPTDQNTGWFTAKLADIGGQTQLMGHRAVLRENPGAGFVTVSDGIISDVSLSSETYVTYTLELRDTKERERTMRAFVRTGTSTVFPRGVLDGYGALPGGAALVPPVTPATGRFAAGANPSAGWITLDDGVAVRGDTIAPEYVVTEKMLLSMTPQTVRVGSAWERIYKNVSVLWRPIAGGAWTTIADINDSLNNEFTDSYGQLMATLPARVRLADGTKVEVTGARSIYVSGIAGVTLPTHLQDVEVVVVYTGPASNDYPWHFEGTAGELVALLYDGETGDEEAATGRVRYDAAAVAALDQRIRVRVFEPEQDLRDWLEKNVYQPLRVAPVLNASGEITPVRYTFPSTTAGLLTLTDANTDPDADWMHGVSDAVNVVDVTYYQDFRVDPLDEVDGQDATGDGLAEAEVIAPPRFASSIGLIGNRPLKIKSAALRTIGGSPHWITSADSTQAWVSLLAEEIAADVFDRIGYGGQRITSKCDRTDAAVEAARLGDWVVVALTWLPDYRTGERGQSRLAQIVSRKNVSPTRVAFSLLDGGPNLAALTVPTLGSLTADSDGSVNIPVTAIPAGVEARVDFAVNITQPATTSGLWTFAGRVASPSTISTPPLPSNATVWVRARSEAAGRVRSGWTTAVSITLAAVPRLLTARLELDDDRVPAFSWTVNALTLGIRLYYDQHDPDEDPVLATFVDVAASAGEYVFSTIAVDAGQAFTVEAEPWTGFGGGAVSGSAGARVLATVLNGDEPSDSRAAGPEVSISLQAANNYLTIFITDIDNEATWWRTYAKRGEIAGPDAWPTMDGTNEANAVPDYMLQVGDFGRDIRSRTIGAMDGHWYVVVEAFDVNGNPGPLEYADIEIVGGSGGPAGQLSDVRAQLVAGNKDRISWGHDAAVAGAGWTVRILQTIDDGAAVEFVTGRDPKLDGATDTVTLAGYYETAVINICNKGSPGCAYHQYVYTVELYSVAVLVASYTASKYQYSLVPVI